MKIRTDFVTNSSSSSFTLMVRMNYRDGSSDCFFMYGCAEGGEGYDEYYEVNAKLSPKKLGTCENINELICMLNENIIAEEKKIIDQDYRAKSYKKFITNLENNGSMIKIKNIQVRGKSNGGDWTEEQVFDYDLQTGEYRKTINGKIYESEGAGGELIIPDADEATMVDNISMLSPKDDPTEIIDYLYSGNTKELSKDAVIYIPETVRMIDVFAFHCDCEEIHIGKNVEKIAGSAIRCPKLKKITVDEQNKYYRVEGNALIENETAALVTITDKSAKDFVFPKGIKKIMQFAFCGSNLTTVKVPDGVKIITDVAFAECKKLKKLELPASVTEIGNDIFLGRRKIAIKAPPKSYAYKYAVKNKLPLDAEVLESSDNSADLFRDKTFSLLGFSKRDAGAMQKTVGARGAVARDAVSTKTNYVVYTSEKDFEDLSYYKALFLMLKGQKIIFLTKEDLQKMIKSNVLPPQNYFENEVQRIAQGGEQAMFIKGNTLLRYIGLEKKVVVPDGIETIADSAFNEMPVEEVVLPDTVKRIGKSAFAKCNKLVRVNIPTGIDTLSMSVFSGCSNLENVTIPATVTLIDKHAFLKCKKLSAIKIPDRVRIIDDYAFHECESLTDLTIGKDVRKIGAEAFSVCTSLESVTLPDGLMEIGMNAFVVTKIKQIVLPASISDGVRWLASADVLESLVFLNDRYEFHDYFGEPLYPPEKIKYIGRKGSTTEAFAKKNNYQFEELDDTDAIHNR